MFDLIEDPGIADGSPADHDPVHAIAIAVLAGFFGGFDVAVTEDGDMDARVSVPPSRPVT
jgi:hypothetical protein